VRCEIITYLYIYIRALGARRRFLYAFYGDGESGGRKRAFYLKNERADKGRRRRRRSAGNVCRHYGREREEKRGPSAACKAARIYIFISPFTTIFKYMRKKMEFEAAAPSDRLFSLFHTLSFRQPHTHCEINFLTTTTRGRNWHCSLFSAPPSQLFIFPGPDKLF
jgi:hypothetical protein